MIDLANIRVLLVEDNELDARSLLRHLREAAPHTHFDTTHVGDLAAALTALEEGGFDCVLLDLSLPDSHGLMSVEALLAKSAKSPIVVLTGLDDPEVAVEAVERGAQDYLTKQSIDTDRVTRAIRYAITRHRSETQLRSMHEQLDVMQDRERIARDLHDTVIQQLFATGMSLQGLASRTQDAEARTRLSDAVDGIDESIRQLREAIFGIHKAQEDLSLVEQVAKLAEERAAGLGFAPVLRAGTDLRPVSPDVQHELLSTLGEALSNVAKHAGASAVEVTLRQSDREVILEVTDNGVGVRSQAEARDELTGHGLKNLADRAEQCGGEFSVRPGPGGGTTLRWSAELARETDA